MSGLPAGAGALLGKRLGKYEILALLAIGGTAEIYLARIAGAAGFEKYVVIKCLHDHLADDPEFVKMFLDEARLAALLDHSNIVQTFELGEHEHRYYMVMEYLAGLSLAMIVRRATERLPGGKLPVAFILNVAAQASAGLHYAHERQANGRPLNIVHRDISPQNLVIGFEGVVKLVDFGIARAELRETKTKAGTIKGKFAYMSPEQCVAANVDRRTDVFALGVIVWELFTGRRLFKRNSPYETYQAVLECNIDAPSKVNHEIDPAVDDLVLKAIAKDADDRYASAEAFGDAMLGYLHHRGRSSGPAEVARFVEESFPEELEEHGERMRELIGNRDVSLDAGVSWDDEDDKKRSDTTVALTGSKGDAHHAGDLPTPSPDDAGTDDDLPADKTRIDASPGGDLPVDKTRIEANPLAHEHEHDTAIADGPPAPQPRFPELANLPTQLSDANPPASAPSGAPQAAMAAELAPTALGAQPIDPGSQPTFIGETGPRPQPALPQGASPYPVVSGRPISSELAPSGLPPPQRSPYAGETAPPVLVASVMPPLGERASASHDSVAGVAQQARPMPLWMLAGLFVAALGLALAITIVIARIIR
jgi:serine/threonine-protein kinase